jgi:phosphate-selective porin OprO and OprP
MRLPKMFCALLAVVCFAPVPLLHAQSDKPADDSAQSKPATKAASEDEVQQLRREVAALRAQIQKLVEAKGQPEAGAHLVQATAVLATNSQPASNASQPEVTVESSEEAAEPPAEPYVIQAPKKDSTAPVTAGWNGEHFFIKSADGQFQIQPYGYVQTDYRSYWGDGSPANTFSVRRGRFGFQGNYGSHYQFGILVDAASTTGSTIRDVYLNAKFNNAFQIQGGQFKEPFAQELNAGITNIDFMDRGLQSALYPSAASAFRSPGITIHGDIKGGEIQYWAGAFNGKGFSINNTTSVPETVGRLRFYPWRSKPDSALHGLAFGGSVAYSMSRGLSNEQSPPMQIPDGAYNWFPQFPVNGNVWRYEGEFTYLKGPWALRDEYVAAQWNRTGVGTLELGGLGFSSLPNIRFQAWNSAITYLLTGENRPENGTPRVKHPVFGPSTEAGGAGARGLGAWELGFRYSGIQGNEPGVFINNIFTPQLVPTFNQHTDQFTFGVNWYLNYWVRFQADVDIDRLKEPSTIGAVPQNYVVVEERLQYRF